jgi:hypothetical protein
VLDEPEQSLCWPHNKGHPSPRDLCSPKWGEEEARLTGVSGFGPLDCDHASLSSDIVSSDIV